MDDLKKLFQAAQGALIDKYTIENEPISSLGLMERAASKLTKELINFFPKVKSYIIFAGGGNNGGDGYVIGRLLLNKGFNVVINSVVPNTKLSEDCETNFDKYIGKGGTYNLIERIEHVEIEKESIIIDALFGSGLNRPIEKGLLEDLITLINKSGNKIVSVDIPSGLFGEDNTNNHGAIVKADYTYTFQYPKLSFFFPENYKYVGKFKVIDIGLHPKALKELPSPFYQITEKIANQLIIPDRFDHKGTLGNALLIVGSYKMQGAAILSGSGALRSGTGLLTLHIPTTLRDIVHQTLPEALVITDDNEYHFTRVNDIERYSAIGIGCGIGKEKETVEGIRNLLTNYKGKIVIDADALNIISENRELLKLLPSEAILTPHPKEFERLVGKTSNSFDRLNKLLNFAADYKVNVVLKGAYTFVASPDKKCYINMTGNQGMAKGGSGDILTGIITSLLSSGHHPLQAALLGVYAHGLSGDIAAGLKGYRGMKSGDIADNLGETWKIMEQQNLDNKNIK